MGRHLTDCQLSRSRAGIQKGGGTGQVSLRACSASYSCSCRSIGLCFGAPRSGKTLSAVRYSQADAIGQLDPWTPLTSARLLDRMLYTPSVVSTPGKVGVDLRSAREHASE